MSSTFEVTMLDVLREPFEEWLRGRMLKMIHVPGTGDDVFAVVPTDELVAMFDNGRDTP